MKKKVTLACVNCGSRNYSTNSNYARSEKRLELKKFCKRCNAHTNHKQTK